MAAFQAQWQFLQFHLLFGEKKVREGGEGRGTRGELTTQQTATTAIPAKTRRVAWFSGWQVGGANYHGHPTSRLHSAIATRAGGASS
jgi:hypothetical protein